MNKDQPSPSESKRSSSGPLRLLREGDQLIVTGFGLWIPVASEEEGRELIRDLEDQGYKICY
ncbi:MAG: hypothetical protein AB1664_23760 [Thermodesulfobacteriota bacterium]